MGKPMTGKEFATSMQKLALDRAQAAELLQVSDRMIRYYEDDVYSTPWPLATLLRVMLDQKLSVEYVRQLGPAKFV